MEAITRAGEESRGWRSNQLTAKCDSGLRSADQEKDPSTKPLPQPPPALPYASYVTHILYLDGPGTPKVDRERLSQMGIETLRLYGRPITTMDGEKEVTTGMRYDNTALVQALEVVLGKKGDAMLRGEPGSAPSKRRNTLENVGNSGRREGR